MLSLLDMSLIRDDMDIKVHPNTFNKDKYMKQLKDDAENKIKI